MYAYVNVNVYVCVAAQCVEICSGAHSGARVCVTVCACVCARVCANEYSPTDSKPTIIQSVFAEGISPRLKTILLCLAVPRS